MGITQQKANSTERKGIKNKLDPEEDSEKTSKKFKASNQMDIGTESATKTGKETNAKENISADAGKDVPLNGDKGTSGTIDGDNNVPILKDNKELVSDTKISKAAGVVHEKENAKKAMMVRKAANEKQNPPKISMPASNKSQVQRNTALKENGVTKGLKEIGEANVAKTPLAPEETGPAKAQPKISVQARKPAADKKSEKWVFDNKPGGAANVVKVKEAANVVKDKEAAITNVAKDQGTTSPSSSLEVATYQVLGVP